MLMQGHNPNEPPYWRTLSCQRAMRWYLAHDQNLHKFFATSPVYVKSRVEKMKWYDLLVDWLLIWGKTFSFYREELRKYLPRGFFSKITMRQFRRLHPVMNELKIMKYSAELSVQKLEFLKCCRTKYTDIWGAGWYPGERPEKRLRRYVTLYQMGYHPCNLLNGWRAHSKDLFWVFFAHLDRHHRNELVRRNMIALPETQVSLIDLTPDLLISERNLPLLLKVGVRVDHPVAPPLLWAPSLEWMRQYLQAFTNPRNNPTGKKPEEQVEGSLLDIEGRILSWMRQTYLYQHLLRNPTFLVTLCLNGWFEEALRAVNDRCTRTGLDQYGRTCRQILQSHQRLTRAQQKLVNDLLERLV